MKALLVISLAVCLWHYWPLRRQYGLFCLYLALCIPATLAFRSEASWLRQWYVWLALPVAWARLAAGVEILHRQTEGYRKWPYLTAGAWLLAIMYCAVAWVWVSDGTAFTDFIAVRRLYHMWLAFVFVVTEAFWLTQGGGAYRRSDHVALLFGVIALNHGTVGFLAGISEWDGVYQRVKTCSWSIESACYLALSLRSRVGPSPHVYFRLLLGRSPESH